VFGSGRSPRNVVGETTPADVAAQDGRIEAHRDLGRGLLWLGTSNLLSKVLDALSAIFVLRFLSKEELGLATLAWATTTLVESFNGFGIGGALIQSATVSETAKASAHWYAVGASACLTLLVCVAAPELAALYGMPQLVPLIRVSSLKLLLVGCANVPLAVASRSLRFERLGAIASTSTVLASLLTIVLAALGWGAWAPLLGNTAHGAFQLLGVVVLAPMLPRLTLSWVSLRPLARTGWALACAGAAGQVSRNLDYWLLGRFGGASALGSYRVAFDLAMLPTFTTLQVASRSALPVYARLVGAPARLAGSVAWTARTASLVLIAPLLIVFIEGEALFAAIGKVSDPGLILTTRILCVAAFLRAATQHGLPALVASGYSRLALLEALLSAVVLAASFLFSILLLEPLDAPVRIACGWLLACLVLLPIELVLVRRLGRGVAGGLLRAVRSPVLVALGVGLVYWPLQQLSPLAPGVPRIMLHAASLLALYGLALRYVLKVRLSQLRFSAHDETAR
jgi:O-antigen/teichoic acid export membrane protein